MKFKFTYFYFSLLIIVAEFSFISAYAQDKATVFGKLKTEDGRPAELVSVSILGLPGGTDTDRDGKYTLKVPSDKDITLVFSSISYQTEKININLKPGEKKEISRTIKANIKSLTEVEIEDIESRKSELQRISTKSVTVIPSVSGGIEALIKTMPGVSSNNELSSQYSVRGGNFDENLVYVNGIEIYRPFLVRSGQQEGLSFVNSDLVASILFSAGGFEAKYGDKMSSVLDIIYKKPTRFGGSVTGSLQGGAAHIEGVAAKKKLTYLFGLRQKSNQYVLKSLDTKGDYKPSFTDIQTYLSYTFSKKWELGFLGNYSRNHYNVVPHTRQTSFGTIQQALRLTIFFDGQEVDAFDTYQGAFSTTFKPNDKLRLRLITSAFNSNESETFDIQGEYYIDQLENNFGKETFGNVAFNRGVGGFLNHARNYLDSKVYNIEQNGTYYSSFCNPFQWGIKYSREDISDRLSEWNLLDSAGYTLPRREDFVIDYIDEYDSIHYKPYTPYHELLMNDIVKTNISLVSNRYSAYIQNKWNLDGDSTAMSLTAGIRASYWDVNKEFVAGPRATLSYKPNWKRDVIFRFSSGYYYQPPFYRELRDFEGKLHTDVKAQTAIHAVSAMDWNFMVWNRPFKFVSEIYYKYLYNLIPYEIDNVRVRYYSDQTATGYATGIDFKVNGEFVPGMESWASLSIMKTQEDVKGDGYGYIPRPQDQRVTFGMFFQDYLPKNPTYKMHLNFLYGSGLPFGPPHSQRYQQTLKMPPYLRVDIGFSKQLKSEDNPLTKGNPFRNFKNIWLSLEVFNLLQANNVVSYIWVKDVTNNQYAVPNYLTSRQLNLKLFFDF